VPAQSFAKIGSGQTPSGTLTSNHGVVRSKTAHAKDGSLRQQKPGTKTPCLTLLRSAENDDLPTQARDKHNKKLK
jgi:hypothetical protein